MKITKRQLRRIIKEERARLLKESEDPVDLLQIAYGNLAAVSQNMDTWAVAEIRSEVNECIELVRDAIIGLGGRI